MRRLGANAIRGVRGPSCGGSERWTSGWEPWAPFGGVRGRVLRGHDSWNSQLGSPPGQRRARYREVGRSAGSRTS
jgi:hypothetical protein